MMMMMMIWIHGHLVGRLVTAAEDSFISNLECAQMMMHSSSKLQNSGIMERAGCHKHGGWLAGGRILDAIYGTVL